MTTERRVDFERMGRIEGDIVWLKDITGKTADNVTDIKIILARQEGERKAIKRAAHAASWLLGLIMGLIGGKS